MNARSVIWQAVCRVDDIPRLGARRVARERGVAVAVFRGESDRVFALLDRCPHKGGPLSQGIVFGAKVACPLHNWTIDLDSGCAAAPDEGCVRRFAVRVESGRVMLDATTPLATAPTGTTVPSFATISWILPRTGHEISTVALSVITSTMDWCSVT